jgi:hypothetical protein
VKASPDGAPVRPGYVCCPSRRVELPASSPLFRAKIACRILAGAANPCHAACARTVSAAGLAPTSGEVVTQFQSDSSRTDSPVRILHAQPGSAVSGRHVELGFRAQHPALALGHVLGQRPAAIFQGCADQGRRSAAGRNRRPPVISHSAARCVRPVFGGRRFGSMLSARSCFG